MLTPNKLPISTQNTTTSAQKAIDLTAEDGVIDLTSDSEGKEEKEAVDSHQKTRPAPGSLSIFCKSCSTQVGYLNHTKGGITLFKWAVTVPTTSRIPGPPQLAECISATLSATKARSGSSKCLLLPIPGTEPPATEGENRGKDPAFYTQILIPAITYASTEQPPPSCPVPGMKILYRPVGKNEIDKMLEDLDSDVQEVTLAWEEIRRLTGEEGVLMQSTSMLPVGQREFRGCKVGLLRRWVGSQ
jgi:hypothetical protein